MERRGWLSALSMRAVGMVLGALVGLALVTVPVWGVEVHGDQGFSQVPGVTGQGTREDPYRITGEFDAEGRAFGLRIRNTTAHFVVHDARFIGATEAGLWLEDVRNGWVVRCRFEGNGVGVRTSGRAEVTFALNTFRGNNTHAVDLAHSTQWDDGLVGNWWEGYAGVDENRDGKGDTPWEVARAPWASEVRLDRFPLVEPLAGVTPPEGGVLLQVFSSVGERHEVVSEAESSFVMTTMGMRMPMTVSFRMVVEELVTGSHGAGSYYDVRQTVLEDTGSTTFMGMPDEYLSDKGKVTQVRLHRFGGLEAVAGDLVRGGSGTPTKTIGLPARWLRVGDTWTHTLEMDAEELGIPDGVALHRTSTVFDRLEERDGRTLAVLVTEGESDIEGSEWNLFAGRLDYSAHATFSSTVLVDVATGRVVEESVVLAMDGDITAAGQSVGTLSLRMDVRVFDLPPRDPLEVAPVVTAVDRARRLVIISIGSDHRVQPGERFEVYRVLRLADGTEIEEHRGVLEVQEVMGPDRSACAIVDERFPIQVNDLIRGVNAAAQLPEGGTSGIRLVVEAVVAGSESGQLVPLREAELDSARRSEMMDQLVTIFSERLDQFGMANVEIRLIGDDRIEVLLPGGSSEDAAEVRGLFRTGLLEFRKVIDAAPSLSDLEVRRTVLQEILSNSDQTEWYLVEVDPLLAGDVLDSAVVRVTTDPRQPGPFIALTFNREGAERFVDVLRQLEINDRLAVIVDNTVYSAPLVSDSIKQAAAQGWRAVQDSTTITGRFSLDEARLLATVLRLGSLPVQVVVVKESTY